MSETDNSKNTGQSQIRCEDIQALLFDYMSHELGSARAVLVREHLRRCEACTSEAAEIQSTLELLSNAKQNETGIPDHLTEDRRKKLLWWISHPVMRWIEKHHIITAFTVTILIMAVIGILLAKAKLWKEDPPEEVFPIWIRDRLPAVTDGAVMQPDPAGPEGASD